MRLELGEDRGGTLKLRIPEPDDLDAICRHADNPRVSAQLRDLFPSPYSREDGRRWIEHVRSLDPETVWSIATDEEVIGAVGLHLQQDVYRRSAEIGYWLGEPFWGRGIATLAVAAVTRIAFERLDMIRVYATVFETNPASCRVLEKCGYVLEGRLRRSVVKGGRILDHLLYARVVDGAT